MGDALTRRRFLRASALFAAGTALAGCAAATGPAAPSEQTVATSAPDQPAAAPQDILITYMSTPNHEPTSPPIIEQFQDENPGTTIKGEYVAFNALFEKLQTMAAAKTTPDVFFVAAGWVREFERLRMVTDLKPVLETIDGLNPDKYLITALDCVSTGDQVWAMPFCLQLTFLYYNKTLFDDSGLSYPDETWTWDDMREAALTLTKTDDGGNVTQWGFASRPDYRGYEPACLSNGGLVFDGLDKVVFDSPENVATTETWIGYIHDDKLSPLPAEYSQVQGGAVGYLASGKLAMDIDGGWAQQTLRAQETFDWGMALIPSGSIGRRHITWPDSNGVAANCEHKELAVKFSLALANDPVGVLYYAMPYVTSIKQNPLWIEAESKPSNRIEIMDAAMAEAIPGAEMVSYRWMEWYDAWKSELMLAFIGERGAAESVKAAHAAMHAIVTDL